MSSITIALLVVVCAGGILMTYALCRIAGNSDEMMEAMALIALRRDLPIGSRVTDDPTAGISNDPARARARRAGSDAAVELFDEVGCPVCYGDLADCLLCRGRGVVLVYDDPGARR